MDEATLRQAVEPFFSTKADGAGTGLGLSMVHGFSVQSGGTFTLQSRPGAGTTATITLPSADVSQLSSRDEAAVTACGSKLILLVDDDDDVRSTTAAMFEDGGHVVLQAADVDEAFVALKANPGVEAVVTDYLMPRRTGVDLIRQLRDEGASTPVMVITGYMGRHDPLPEGTMRMRKPFNRAELLECFGRLFED